ncbi:DinB family protein [Leeuwenhoekiella aestuarii]|uniref:DinB family protein n=1 Tax=Leeuwenhoekiella aestuarii TaxID=2249426 RepID=A0A4Q0NQZ2_9FLAO|nr:DinB family protein [Leeuwenhoekiella aestuarii]RXG11975.1 DinB family protein [Leeuwenhoekiella aestuarii]RXG13533.1 DinB family protein [Leeuwenhoekiella aestuarii]
MEKLKQPEVWLRGPVENIPVLLQPVAFALLQTKEELHFWLSEFPQEKLWKKPSGRASVAFHLQHLTGVLDRMLTYAKAEKLSEDQFQYLKLEGVQNNALSIKELLKAFEDKVEEAISFLKTIDSETLTETRIVGRKELPTTLFGLLSHAGEHSQRHLGQLLVTVSFLKSD